MRRVVPDPSSFPAHPLLPHIIIRIVESSHRLINPLVVLVRSVYVLRRRFSSQIAHHNLGKKNYQYQHEEREDTNTYNIHIYRYRYNLVLTSYASLILWNCTPQLLPLQTSGWYCIIEKKNPIFRPRNPTNLEKNKEEFFLFSFFVVIGKGKKSNLQSELSESLPDLRFRGTGLDPESLVRIYHRRRRIRSATNPNSVRHGGLLLGRCLVLDRNPITADNTSRSHRRTDDERNLKSLPNCESNNTQKQRERESLKEGAMIVEKKAKG